MSIKMERPQSARHDTLLAATRREFLSSSAGGIGLAALATLLKTSLTAAPAQKGSSAQRVGLSDLPHFTPTAKRVIFLFQSGAPSQLDLFDHKPKLAQIGGKELPDSVRRGQRLTTMTSSQASFPIAPSLFRFDRHGDSGAEISELLPHTAKVVDDLCFLKTLHTEAINHDPAITYIQTGAQLAGRPCAGAWLAYGLGSLNNNLPTFVTIVSQGSGLAGGQPLYDRLWGSGFLPSTYQGVKLRSIGDPVLYLSNPPGVSRTTRRRILDDLSRLNGLQRDAVGDPEIATRIAQYELAYRMQSSVPELTDVSSEPDSTFEMYGPKSRQTGTYAANCLLARRLVERGVRFVQLFHRGWDQHAKLPTQIKGQVSDTDQASAALILDLKRRGMLDDTLVVWGGEFGRTVYCQGRLTADDYGRDHHPRCYTIWLAGGGIKGGITYGETDDFSYNIVRDAVHVHDLNATLLHCLGIDHEALTYQYQGRDHRLTDVHGRVVTEILA